MKTSSILLALTLSYVNYSYQQNNDVIQDNKSKNNVTESVEYILLNSEEIHPCARKCVKNSTPMICRYEFKIEWYHSLSKACYNCPFNQTECFLPDCIPADGMRRPILVVNRQLPGPSIEVCLGDEVIIDVHNLLQSESTTVHWHGHHQKDSPYMDGVPFVTQCPIQPGTSFRYIFLVKNAGTHFWHSHSGFQRADGAFGAFIVRRSEEENVHSNLYDYDLSAHTINILDWDTKIGIDKFTDHHHNTGSNKPSTLLVNGLGRFWRTHDNGSDPVLMPISRFIVENGYRYRFRVINAGFLNCPIEISVDNHTLTAISSDGSDFKPVKVNSIVTYAGERFDFVLNANQEKGSYWMRFSGLMDCDARFTSAHQVGILGYKGVGETEVPESEPTYESSHKDGKQLNSLNQGTEANGDEFVSLPHLSSVEPEIKNGALQDRPDFQYYISYDFYKIDNPHFHKAPLYGFKNVTNPLQQTLTPQLNYISYKNLPFPMLSQRHQINDDMICNETTVENCEKEYCECTHIINLPLDAVVELVLIDKGFAYDANHPFHLHGHSFRVVAMEKLGPHINVSEVLNHDRQGFIKRNLVDPPIKDTVTVPDGGYTIVRFKASNPGYWLFHCHIEFHVEVGMALVFKIGQDKNMPPVPHGFPICGDYLPSIHSKEECDSNAFFGVQLFQKFLPDYCSPNGGTNNKQNIFISILPIVVYYVGTFVNKNAWFNFS